MSEKQKPVVIEHESSAESRHEKKQTYIKDSASRVMNIAQTHGLDALLQKTHQKKPH